MQSLRLLHGRKRGWLVSLLICIAIRLSACRDISMNRPDFQQLAEVRIREAHALLKDGHSDGAYYLADYAVECALKACIAKNVKQHEFPPPQKVVGESYYTHDRNKLLVTTGL